MGGGGVMDQKVSLSRRLCDAPLSLSLLSLLRPKTGLHTQPPPSPSASCPCLESEVSKLGSTTGPPRVALMAAHWTCTPQGSHSSAAALDHGNCRSSVPHRVTLPSRVFVSKGKLVMSATDFKRSITSSRFLMCASRYIHDIGKGMSVRLVVVVVVPPLPSTA